VTKAYEIRGGENESGKESGLKIRKGYPEFVVYLVFMQTASGLFPFYP
jgi:hypothetical protein